MYKKNKLHLVCLFFVSSVLLASLFSCSSEVTIKPHFSEGEKDYYQEDAVCGHYHVANAERSFKWPEHPSGKIIQRTNNLGFREDQPTNETKSCFRILVTGDSHTDGVLLNSESYPNVLETLYKKETGKSIDAINAGHGYYGLQNYLGLLNKSLYLKPDAFIVTIYTGNDFIDAIRIEVESERMPDVTRPADYFDDLWKVDEQAPGFTGQLMNQVKFFKVFPDQKQKALAVVQQNLLEIKKVCEQNNIQLGIVLLPTKVDVEPELDSARIRQVCEILKLNTSDLSVNQQLSSEIFKWSKQNKIACWDLLPTFVASTDTLYWNADYHVNHKGHALIANFLMQQKQSLASSLFPKD